MGECLEEGQRVERARGLDRVGDEFVGEGRDKVLDVELVLDGEEE